MKKIEWIRPNKMKFKSGHFAFDEQTNIILPGSLMANTIKGAAIRPFTPNKISGINGADTYEDINEFNKVCKLPHYAIEKLIDLTKTRTHPIMIYALYYTRSNSKVRTMKHIVGCIITEDHLHDYKFMDSFIVGNYTRGKSRIIAEAKLYLSN